jgi:hypothetical protein
MELVAFLGNDKETWGQITALINREQWDKIVLVQNKSMSGFPIPVNGELVSVDSNLPMAELKNEIQDKVKRCIGGEFEVALSIASGNGKEHMALVSALLNIPVGIKLVVFTKKGIEFLT